MVYLLHWFRNRPKSLLNTAPAGLAFMLKGLGFMLKGLGFVLRGLGYVPRGLNWPDCEDRRSCHMTTSLVTDSYPRSWLID